MVFESKFKILSKQLDEYVLGPSNFTKKAKIDEAVFEDINLKTAEA